MHWFGIQMGWEVADGGGGHLLFFSGKKSIYMYKF